MKEYIEREAALKHKRLMQGFGFSQQDEYLAAAVLVEDIEKLPAADVVEVVRCKDCAYGHETSSGLILCYFWQRGDSAIPALEPDAYCSYGERKEE